MKIITLVIRQPRLPILCGEDKMDDHLYEGLGHECRPVRACLLCGAGSSGRCPRAISWCPFGAVNGSVSRGDSLGVGFSSGDMVKLSD